MSSVSNTSGFSSDMAALGEMIGIGGDDEFPQDPGEATRTADLLCKLGESCTDAAETLRAVDTNAWTGEAADAARAIVHDRLPGRYADAGAAYLRAGNALHDYARVLAKQKPEGQDAVRRRDAAEARWEQYRQQYESLRQAGGDPGPPDYTAFNAAKDAQGEVNAAKAAIKAADERAAQEVAAAAKAAPPGPGVFAELGEFLQDLGQFGQAAGTELAVGAWNSVRDTFTGGVALAEGAWNVATTWLNPFWLTSHPKEVFEASQAVQDTVQSAAHRAVTDPAGTAAAAAQGAYSLGKAVINVEGFQRNPFQAAGELVPAAIGTVGGVAIKGAKLGGTAVRAAEDVTQHAPDARTPSPGTGHTPPQQPPTAMHEGQVEQGMLDANGDPYTPPPEPQPDFVQPSKDGGKPLPDTTPGVGDEVNGLNSRPEVHTRPYEEPRLAAGRNADMVEGRGPDWRAETPSYQNWLSDRHDYPDHSRPDPAGDHHEANQGESEPPRSSSHPGPAPEPSKSPPDTDSPWRSVASNPDTPDSGKHADPVSDSAKDNELRAFNDRASNAMESYRDELRAERLDQLPDSFRDDLAETALRDVDVADMPKDVVWRETTEPLFRVDSRDFDDIFTEGFEPRGARLDLGTYVDFNNDSAFVSTSRDPEHFAIMATEFEDRFVYEVEARGGVDVNASLGAHGSEFEEEIAMPGGIQPERIKGRYKILHDDHGNPYLGDYQANPGHLPLT